MNSFSPDLTASIEKNPNEVEFIETEDKSDEEYEMRDQNTLFEDLVIELDQEKGAKIPRFSCACHKCNLAVRKAIKSLPSFAKDLTALNVYAKNIRKSNRKIEIFKLEKCRIRC
jgi:hypothetical protein